MRKTKEKKIKIKTYQENINKFCFEVENFGKRNIIIIARRR
jgi:hypothetical protein